MKLTVFRYKWDDSKGAYRIYEPSEVEHQSITYLSEKDLVHEILMQYKGGQRYVAADSGSYVRMVHALAMKIFVHYRED